ncbi:multicopper oxidase-domain-containing protein [Crepidotus variabilis]|uniref:Multicopper oxidase-domain-containing protein n=1 Tax=Crepidotus variabilis TaxID=179855 RepID=A0A9P6EIG3_9AGAR|nr:multicopper oxidase-domain-containing protein [Crepidotus variabilis]
MAKKDAKGTVLAGAESTVDSLSFPGPLITMPRQNGEFNLNVVNQLRDTSMLVTTITHWHGFFQHGSSWADGPVGATQCPITPNHSFKYSFNAKDQAGTFWYHSHHSTQYCDGLRGPLVVYDPNDPHKALYDVDDPSTGYRFRLVSISCDPNFILSINNHNMLLIEADSENILRLKVNSLQFFVGQRYSFVLNANQNQIPNVGTTGFTNGINSAILRHVRAPAVEPTSVSSTSNPIGAKTAQELMPTGSYYILPPNAVIEVNLPGGSAGRPHPIHLRGPAFDVIQSAGSSTRNYVNPVRRDVLVSVCAEWDRLCPLYEAFPAQTSLP